MSIKAKPRKDKDKKPKKPHGYKWKEEAGERHSYYTCPEHDRVHKLTSKQLAGEKPVKCEGHEFTFDFMGLDRIMTTM